MKYVFTALFTLCWSVNAFTGINTWTQCSGTDGQFFDSLLIDTTTSGRIYAGAYGELAISNDYGTTWAYSVFSSAAPSCEIESIAVNPKSPNEVYLYLAHGLGIAKNTTYGYGNWISITNDLNDAPAVPNMLFDPENVARMYVASVPFGYPIYYSDNTGYNWTPSYSGITTDQASGYLIMHPIHHNWLYAGVGGTPGIYVSMDGATTWNSVPLYMTVESIAIDPIDNNNIYAGGYAGFASSFDGGYVWNICADTTITNYGIKAVVVNPLNPNIIYAGTQYNGVFKSKNQGSTWYAMNTGMPVYPVWALAYDTITRTLFAGLEGSPPSQNIPIGVWMYQDTDLTTPPPPVNVPKEIWQMFE